MKFMKIILLCICLLGITACDTKDTETDKVDQQNTKVDSKELFETYLKDELVNTLGIIDFNERIHVDMNNYEHTNGIISTYIHDFDNDKSDEMLVIYKDTDNLIHMDIYEIIENEVRKMTEIKENELFDDTVENIMARYSTIKETAIYLKEYEEKTYIMVEMGSYIDGGITNIGAFNYNGEDIQGQGNMYHSGVFLYDIYYSTDLPKSWKTYTNDNLEEHEFLDNYNDKAIALYARYYNSEQEKTYDYYFSSDNEVITSFYSNYGIKRDNIHAASQNLERPYILDYNKQVIKLTEYYKTYGDNSSSKWTDFTNTEKLTK
ncbi:MAG: hypothetical protein ACK5LC_13910 [Coprobacillaceae bacterium]